jgi:outer membrane protein assembly factor BamB
MRRGLRAALVPALVGLGLGLGAGPARADLSTFGYSNARTGTLIGHAGISPAQAMRLKPTWRANVAGAVTAQPLVLDGLLVRGRRRTVVIAATEHGVVVALDGATGHVVWRRQLGHRTIRPDCDASPDAEFGVTATPVADRRAGRVYAVDVDGRAWALALRSGRVVSGWPRRVHPAGGDFVWGALALSRGALYVPIASLCDSGQYNGGVVSVDLAHPLRMHRWFTTAGTGAYAGGIWGWGGVSIDNETGDVFGATGNSLGTANEATPYAESVVRLSASLVLRQANDPLIGPFHSTDRDFGTTPVLVHARGCPAQAFAINKDGELFVYDRSRISSGPTQRLRVAADTPTGIPLYGMPAWDPGTRTLLLVSPSAPPGSALRAGVQAFTLGAACQLSARWQQSFDYPDAGSAPTIAGSVVYIATGRNGRLRAYDLANGRPLWAHRLSRKGAFGAPAVDRDSVFVGDWGGHVCRISAAR